MPFRIPPRPRRHHKHAEEQLKLAAQGLQLLAVTTIIAVVVTPFVNPTFAVPRWLYWVLPPGIGAVWGAAFVLLRYIPTPKDSSAPPAGDPADGPQEKGP